MLVSRIPWPLEKGDKLRAYHQLCHLAKNHEVHLCCLNDDAEQEAAVSHLKTITPHVYVFRLNKLTLGLRMLRAVLSDKPFQVHYFFQSSVQKSIRQIIGEINPDHIYCQLVRTAEYVKNLHEYKKTIDYMDALSAGYRRRTATEPWWKRPFVNEEARRLVNYENLIFEYFDHHTIISDQDRQLIYHASRNKIEVIPNGIDTDFFTPVPTEKKYEVVFTGNMSYAPNVDCSIRLAHEIMPLVRKQIPDAKLLIAGAQPTSSVKALENDFVHVSGWMTDIRKAYNESVIFMAPMRIGSGLQNKMLEAMSMNLACITTPVAGNALKAVHGKHIFIEENNEDCAARAVQLLRDEKLRNDISREGSEFVRREFNWSDSVKKLESVMSLA